MFSWNTTPELRRVWEQPFLGQLICTLLIKMQYRCMGILQLCRYTYLENMRHGLCFFLYSMLWNATYIVFTWLKNRVNFAENNLSNTWDLVATPNYRQNTVNKACTYHRHKWLFWFIVNGLYFCKLRLYQYKFLKSKIQSHYNSSKHCTDTETNL